MFTKISTKTDSELSNKNVVKLVVDDAINNIINLTGMTPKAALEHLKMQVNQKNTQVIKVKPNTHRRPIIEKTEYQFISSLFN
ncbi:hypothetical protein AADZ84_09140 [Colwelliaceae bacterium MEBiC 14330]